MSHFVESTVEDAALSWLAELDFAVKHGPHIAPGELHAERTGFGETVLPQRLRDALAALNPNIPAEALEDAFRKVTVPQHPSLIANNHAFHRLLVEGVPVEYQKDGRTVPDLVWLVDWEHPEANDWLVVNQFTVIEGQHNRRPDIVIFINGLPLAVIELKNAADESADIWSAFNQFQTYKLQIPSLFKYNAVLVISDGLEARIGTISADRERFMPWRTITGEKVEDYSPPSPQPSPSGRGRSGAEGEGLGRRTELEVLLRGVFEKRRFLDLVRYFIVFEDDGAGTVTKKVAGYHQFHAVSIAVEETIRASAKGDKVYDPGGGYFAKHQPGGAAGDRRIGVVWHTQGSGKSLTMAFYAGRLVTHSSMENPTIVVITDRNDLDDQLFGTFSRCHELLRQKPKQATSREDLRQLLDVASGGVIFTTVHKFFDSNEPISKRRNIVVIADEAHRSQYDFVDGFARRMREALPHASWIGFTGTPIEKADANTRAVFGDYISIYDILRAVEDKATVPIYYEGRLAKLELKANEKPKIDPDFEEATEGEELSKKEYLKTKWAALEKIVGADKRLKLIAEDLVKHWEARLEVMDGKAMIVGMSRRICVELYDQLVQLRPEWHHDADDKGAIKVVMTGSADDGPTIAGHARNKSRREALAKRFKDAGDPLKIVLVRDMWLTGFDVPCLTTMYVDKPMRGHGLMQAIARVNRVFKDKPGGLVVDYLGLAYELKKALAIYTEAGGHGETAIDQEEAVAVMQEKYEICCDCFHGFDRTKWVTGTPAQKLSLLPAAQEHILKPSKDEAPDEKKNRYLKAVTELSKAFALSVPHDKALEIRDDVGFFQAVCAALSKSTGAKEKSADQIEAAIRQIISRAVASDTVIDIFAAAGLKKPDLSILSDEFLAEVQHMPQKNLAVETLRKLLNHEIKVRSRKFLIQSRSFSEMLEESIRKYQNRAIEATAVIEELMALAKQMREANKRGEDLKLSDDELAFYDALEVNDSAVRVLGEPTLTKIARELVEAVRNSVTIDWTEREAVRAKIRVMVKRILRKYGYPPDKQEKATATVLQQAELLCADWAA
jgi:type I restriction enzyme R subunit